jgi:predicted dehydrogenase
MDRRGFVRTTAYTGGSLLLLTSKSAIAQQTSPGRTIKAALIGCGAQGNALRTASADVPGIQWVAICDIWKFSQAKTRGGMLGENKHQIEGDIKVYEDINEMLEKEPSIEACFIATPDFMHAPYSRLCLEKGKAVYCEKMMSNTVEGARDMVRAGKQTGGIFQIGHQRHSNPRYINLRENIIKPGKMLGRITHCYAQWNRGVSASQPLTGVKGYEIPIEVLQKHGYEDIFQFRNWRYFKKYGGGPISDLGAHQIDMFGWMYETPPVKVYATGGVDYYDGTDGKPKYELPDNVMCIYEFKLPAGVMRAYYQVLTTTGSQGVYEKHMGVQGSAIMSELPTSGNQVYAEPSQDWSSFASEKDPRTQEPIIVKATDKLKNKFWEHDRTWQKPPPPSFGKVSAADVRESKALDQWELGVTLNRKPHSPHIQNFIEAVQMKKYEHLTCPVEQGFRCAITVLKCYDSIAKGVPVEFTPADFEV